MNRKYSPEMRERALRMLAETRPSPPNMMSAVRHVAGLRVDPRNRLRGVTPKRGNTWLVGGETVTDSVTRSQSGRITSHTSTTPGTSHTSAYTYFRGYCQANFWVSYGITFSVPLATYGSPIGGGLVGLAGNVVGDTLMARPQ